MLQDSVFWGAIGNNVRLILIPGAIIMALALYFAATLAQGGRGAQVSRHLI